MDDANTNPLTICSISKALKWLIQVCEGIEVNRNSRQYVDLGPLPQACITNPSSCENGGSFSLWVKLLDCPDGGIITSDIKGKDGFRVYCGQDQIK